MFGQKLENAQAQITALLGFMAVIGYKPADASQATAEGFNAALAAHLKTASEAAVNTAVAPLNADLAAFRDGLKAAGIEIVFGAEHNDAAKRSAAVKDAVAKVVSAQVATKSAAAVASAGHDGALATPPAGGGGTVADANVAPANAEEFLKTLNGISDPSKRQAYSAKHLSKFIS